MESIVLQAQIENLDPVIHKALRERLIARYRVYIERSSVSPNENSAEKEISKPSINANGNLVIPFSSDKRYHWWNGGQSIPETLKEIEERMKIS